MFHADPTTEGRVPTARRFWVQGAMQDRREFRSSNFGKARAYRIAPVLDSHAIDLTVGRGPRICANYRRTIIFVMIHQPDDSSVHRGSENVFWEKDY